MSNPALFASGQTCTINHVSRATGLSTSILRIWELRYGWPSPIRLDNGYRAYTLETLEALKYVAARHHEGVQVRELIREGRPVLPESERPARRNVTLVETRQLAGFSSSTARSLKEELCRAIETHRIGCVRELLQRGSWQLRRPEILACKALVVVGLAELERDEHPMPESHIILSEVVNRCRQSAARIPKRQQTIGLYPVSEADQACAWVAQGILSQRGIGAMVIAQPPASGSWVLVGDSLKTSNRPLGRLTALSKPGAWDLSRILSEESPPWHQAAA